MPAKIFTLTEPQRVSQPRPRSKETGPAIATKQVEVVFKIGKERYLIEVTSTIRKIKPEPAELTCIVEPERTPCHADGDQLPDHYDYK